MGVFLWLLWSREPSWAEITDVHEIRRRWAAVVSLAALALMLTLFFGHEWLTLFVHTGVAAGLMLPSKDVPAAAVGLAVLVVGAGLAAGTGWLTTGRFALPAVALCLLMAAFARHLATIAELRAAREEIARLAVAEERLRFARDLHDLLGHSLSLITLKSELAACLLPSSPEKAAVEVRDVEGVARRALREVREAVAGYRRPTLDEELRGAREVLRAAGIDCRIEHEAGVPPSATDAVLAWAVREGVTNVIRHSRAKRCEIRVTRRDAQVQAQVTDDGRGSSLSNSTAGGSGLSGLAERVYASGGELEAGPLPGGGFRLRVSLPLQENAKGATEPAPSLGRELG